MLRIIGDNTSAILNKAVNYYGFAGISVGTVQSAANTELVREVAPNLAQACGTSPSWVAIASAIGAISFAIKNLVGVYLDRIESKNRIAETNLKKEESELTIEQLEKFKELDLTLSDIKKINESHSMQKSGDK